MRKAKYFYICLCLFLASGGLLYGQAIKIFVENIVLRHQAQDDARNFIFPRDIIKLTGLTGLYYLSDQLPDMAMLGVSVTDISPTYPYFSESVIEIPLKNQNIVPPTSFGWQALNSFIEMPYRIVDGYIYFSPGLGKRYYPLVSTLRRYITELDLNGSYQGRIKSLTGHSAPDLDDVYRLLNQLEDLEPLSDQARMTVFYGNQNSQDTDTIYNNAYLQKPDFYHVVLISPHYEKGELDFAYMTIHKKLWYDLHRYAMELFYSGRL
jgi:hypothetical protein